MPGPFYFAWAGGAIQDQQIIVTNGNTHGGLPNISSIVGDTAPGQIVNLAVTAGLEEGALYRIEGPGISGSTYFIYDPGILSGAPNSLNLLSSPSLGIASATFKTTKSVPVGEVPGIVSAGSNVVVFDAVVDLTVGGIYGIRGTGVAQTTQTTSLSGTSSGSSTQPVITGSAFFIYTGSGSAQMKYLVADVNTHTGVDITGQPTSTTTYSVSLKDATATASGEFPMEITGMPDEDWYNITSIPTGVLASLTTGLRYNISGNGLQVGTTFVAPSGGTEIEIDQPATSAQLNAILTITGPRTPDSAFDPTVHDRFDADILDIEIAQEEGSFATLNVRLKLANPGIGLLAVGQSAWCWLSWQDPAGGDSAPLIPLFNGRLVGVPKLQANEVVQLEFLARPDDFGAQKLALAQSLSVLPYYDPVWLAANVNPDTVLETYSALWHIDRTSLAVTTSDMLQGEDGTVSIGEDQAFYDNFSLSYGQPPLVAVNLAGTVSWQQEADGNLDVTSVIVNAFHAQGSPWSGSFAVPRGYATGPGGGGLIATLCGEGLKSSWPAPGTSIGGGWSLATLNDSSGYPLCYCWDANRPVGWLSPKVYNVTVTSQALPPAGQAGTANAAQILTAAWGKYTFSFPLNVYKVRMVLQYKADRRRTETVTAVMTADVQQLLSDSSENDRESIELTSDYIGQGVDPGGEIPLGDLSYRSYFQTDRGAASFEYLLLAARAKLRARSRAVDITFAVKWTDALGLGLNLRKSVTLTDRRLPGGSATGKIKSYRLTVSEGRMLGEFTIGCAIGNGDASTAQTGVPVYVDDGYVDPGYEVVAGGQKMLLADELAYETLDDFAIDDDGLDLKNLTTATAVNECLVTNGLTTQITGLSPYQFQISPFAGDPLNVIRTFSTKVLLDLKPVAGAEFHTGFFPAVSMLALPKMIDLSAAGEILESMWDSGLGGSTWDGGSTAWDCPT